MDSDSFIPMTLRRRDEAFTLMEVLVAMGVLALLVALITQMLGASQTAVGMDNKRLDAASTARTVFDRMAVDFAQMFKRADVDYYLKTPTTQQLGGNDQLAFYSQVPGYSADPSSAQSPVSLVGYRVNTDSASPYYNQLQRLGYGLAWNGVSNAALQHVSGAATPSMPVVFSSGTGNAISTYWPIATNIVANPDYETVGSQVFRMEYSYLLKGGTTGSTPYPPIWSDTPWDTQASHTSVNGLQDVLAIRMVIAVLDAKSDLLVNGSNLAALATNMQDFSKSTTPNCGDLEAKWNAVVLGSNNGIPRPVAAAIRIYGRTFYLPSSPLSIP